MTLNGNDPERMAGDIDLSSHGDAKFHGCRGGCHFPKNNLHQPGNRGIALIGTSAKLTKTVSKTNPPHHTHNRHEMFIRIQTSFVLPVTQNLFFKTKK